MINLMFCGNKRIFDGMLIALLSIVKHTDETLNVYIMTMNLSEKNEVYLPITENQRRILEKTVKEKNSDSQVTLIDITELFKREMIDSANIKTHYTPYILIRLFSDKVKELPDKLLYLDSDIVCYKDIKKIYNVDISNHEIAASLDYIGRKMINPKYMNSGVLLMNLKMIRETGSFEQAREMCKYKKMMLPDQTAINKTCTKKIWLPDNCNEQKQRKPDTIIRHFSMTIKTFPYFCLQNVKPWQIEDVHKKYKIYDYEDILKEYSEIKNNIENLEMCNQ